MSAYHARSAGPYVLAVSISPGGIPKRPQSFASARKEGLVGDGRNHAKHIRPDRALSIWDYEILQQLADEGFALSPGAAGENLTVVGLNVQQLAPGTLIKIGDVVARLEQPRKPCYVLDAIDPRLKDEIVGRCGYMASLLREGVIRPGMPIEVIMPAGCQSSGQFALEIPLVLHVEEVGVAAKRQSGRELVVVAGDQIRM